MSIVPATSSTGLPAIDQALQPAWVRGGSPETQKAYRAALAFEQTLVEQLSRSLVDSSGLSGGESSSQDGGLGGEEGSSSDASTGILSSLLPQALSEGIMRSGGLGLAAQLTQGLTGTVGAAGPIGAAGTVGAAGSVGAAGATSEIDPSGGVGAHPSGSRTTIDEASGGTGI